MISEWLAKTFFGPVVRAVGRFSLKKVKQEFVTTKALRGGDAIRPSTLHGLLAAELEQLATRADLVSGLSSIEAREWLQLATTIKAFEAYILGKFGDNELLLSQALEELTHGYAQITGEHPSLAIGAVNAAGNAVFARINQDSEGRQLLQSAMTARVAAVISTQVAKRRSTEIDERYKQLRLSANDLLAGARRLWRVPDILAPVALEVLPNTGHGDAAPTTLDELVERVAQGANVALFGDGGIGKTTLLLELAVRLTRSAQGRATIYVDAAIWAERRLPLMDYVAELGAIRARGLDAVSLHQLAANVGMTILLNGWNEIPAAGREDALQRVRGLMSSQPGVNIVLTTRNQHDAGGLVSPLTVRVTGLRWPEQKQVIGGSLPPKQAAEVIEQLALDNRLRIAARNPLILAGVLQLKRIGVEGADNLFDILGAIIGQFESEAPRAAVLSKAPLFGAHRPYLQAIAMAITREKGASIPPTLAKTTVHEVARMLLGNGQLSTRPEPTSVLDALCDQHLLVADGSIVRFAHQRFQEYYAASVVLDHLTADDESRCADDANLLDALNWPFWEDALFLVAQKVAIGNEYRSAKAVLITAARRIDLDLGCQVAGWSGFERQEAPTLFDQMVADTKRYWTSTDEQHKEYGLRCIIDSGFPVFADTLWTLLEDPDDQVRLATYRLGSAGIVERQLGNNVVERVSGWPEKQRCEFVHETAPSADNVRLIMRLAAGGQPNSVRAAAIAALAWHHPASGAAINAWRAAPDEVKAEGQVLSSLDEELAEQIEAVGPDLVQIAERSADEPTLLRLGLMFPDLLANRAKKAILNALKTARHASDAARKLMVARERFPDELAELGTSLAISGEGPFDWVRQIIAALPDSQRHALFELCWPGASSDIKPRFDSIAIGSCASDAQTEALAIDALRIQTELRTSSKEAPALRERYDTARYLLASVPGDSLLRSALKLGDTADYSDSLALVELVSRRATSELNNHREEMAWMPSGEQVDELLRVFWGKPPDGERLRVDLKASLCAIATRTSSTRYLPQTLLATELELDAWSAYDDNIRVWAATPGSRQRPSNPQSGFTLPQALVRCGFAALPGLCSLMTHPSAHHLVYRAIGGILNTPWEALREQRFGFPAIDGAHAKMRRTTDRVQLQPDGEHQAETDRATSLLVEALRAHLVKFDAEAPTRPAPKNPYLISRPNGDLIRTIAASPSPTGKDAVIEALARGDIDDYRFVDCLCALVRQGAFIEDARVVRLLEARCDALGSKPWLEQSESSEYDRVNQLLYFVRPATVLSVGLLDRLPAWCGRYDLAAVVHELAALRLPSAWGSVTFLARQSGGKGPASEAMFDALANGVDSDTFELFLALLRDGTYFRLCRSSWDMERTTSAIAKTMLDRPAWREEILAICSGSSEPLAESLACALLKESDASDDEMSKFGLAALAGANAQTHRSPAVALLTDQFTLRVPLDSPSQYSVHPRSSNKLRCALFLRAQGSDSVGQLSRSILLGIEAGRRELGRPADEPRHPDIGVGKPVDAVLMPANRPSGEPHS